MNGTAAPVSAFLPSPRIPLDLHGQLPPLGLHPAIDRYCEAVQVLRTEVRDAVDALEGHRPGGFGWKAALDADAQAALAGKQPKVWAAAALIQGDPARWAEASALCRTATNRLAHLGETLASDKGAADAIHQARAEAVAQRRPHLRAAWEAAHSGDLLEARLQLRHAEPLSKQVSELGTVHNWLKHGAKGSLNTYEGLMYPDTLGGRGDLGHYWAANAYIRDGLVLNIPSAQDVDYPKGFDFNRLKQPTGRQSVGLYTGESRHFDMEAVR